MRNLRRIDVLLNEDTGEKFSEDDIVKITMIYEINEYVGRISSIGTLELMLDMSRRYKEYAEKIKYEDMAKIEKYEE